MLEFLGKLILGGVIGVVFCIAVETFSGGICIKGTRKYDKFNKDSDERVKNILKNGSGSSKAELQQWWDEHH